MNKILLSGLVGLTVINGAIAVPKVSIQKKNCEDNGNVWVECKNTCVPINPCLSTDKTIRDGYCVKWFEDEALRQDFLEIPINSFLDMIAKTEAKSYSVVDGNFVAVKRADGCYQVLEFRDIYPQNSEDGASAENLFTIANMLYGTHNRDVFYTIVDSCTRKFEPKEAMMEKDCIRLVDFYRDFARTRIERMNFEYDDYSGKCDVFVDVTSDQCRNYDY